jgi:hypothetical protein
LQGKAPEIKGFYKRKSLYYSAKIRPLALQCKDIRSFLTLVPPVNSETISVEYAIQLLLPILGGLWLGNWLTQRFHLPVIWTLVFAILGMLAGLGILYKRYTLEMMNRPPIIRKKQAPPDENRLHVKDLDFLYKEPNPEDDDDDHPWKDDDD